MDLRKALSISYGLAENFSLCAENRGMINDTLYVDQDKVLTIFKNRSVEQASLIAEVVQSDQSGLLPPLVKAKNGAVVIIDGSPAIMWQRICGSHYVWQDHSNKLAIPEAGHISIAKAFWALHASLARSSDLVGNRLGVVHYLPAPEAGDPHIDYATLPSFLQRPSIVSYLQAEALPLKYSTLVHHDMERQNFLHAADGEVVAIVDADSFKRGDLLFEYCRCMMNFMFSDPNYKPIYADHYMGALLDAGLVDPEDIRLIPELIDAFIAKDLLDYCRYESNPPKTNLSQLCTIYDICRGRVEAYFSDFSIPDLSRSECTTFPIIPEPGGF